MQIETLGDAYTYSAEIRMYCAHGPRDGMKSKRECNYAKVLDLETLITTRGRDFPIAMLQSRLRCPRCASRQVRVIWHFPSDSDLKRTVGW
jgi:hypothetical protein